MSELESLCRSLEDSVGGLPALVDSLQRRAARLRSIAAELEIAARRVEGGPDVSRAVDALLEAARAMDASGRSLTGAVHQSRTYVSRTIGSSTAGHPLADKAKSLAVGVAVAAIGVTQGVGLVQTTVPEVSPDASVAQMVEENDDHQLEKAADIDLDHRKEEASKLGEVDRWQSPCVGRGLPERERIDLINPQS